MNTEQKKLFRQIARCSIADEILDNLLNGEPNTHPCTEICEYQQEEFGLIGKKFGPDFEVEFSKETFHMPEPWNGDLDNAEILFVSSNPSFSIHETTPKLAREGKSARGRKGNWEVLPKFKSDEWPLDRAENFFENRFIDEETRSIREEYDNETWKRILKFAGYLLDDETRSIEKGKKLNNAQKENFASRIALTEVVHCKSENEKGVPQARVTCYDKHTRAVIELFLKSSPKKPSPKKTKKVVVMGVPAQVAFAQGILTESLKAGDPEISADKLKNKLEELEDKLRELRKEPKELEKELKRYAQDGFGTLAKNAHFIFIPHPVAQGYSYAEFQRRIDRQNEPLRQ